VGPRAGVRAGQQIMLASDAPFIPQNRLSAPPAIPRTLHRPASPASGHAVVQGTFDQAHQMREFGVSKGSLIASSQNRSPDVIRR
jgi:hypothetical protein